MSVQMRHVYLDHNATTPVLPEILEVIQRYYSEDFGNPSSVHRYGRAVRVAIDDARDQVAYLLGAPASSLFFSSGGTEANNTILKGVAAAYKERGRHLVLSAIEHPCVVDTCAYLAQHGCTITHVPVGADGVIDPEAVRAALTEQTILVSIMHANNEVGTIQPVAEIAQIARQRGILMHTDAVQSFGKLPLRIEALGVDFLTFSGHKLYAPKGIGGWYMRPGVSIHPLLHGGHQERGRRSGTENVAAIVGFGTACGMAVARRVEAAPRLQALRDRLEEGLVPLGVRLFGTGAERLPNTVYFSVPDMDGETLVAQLDRAGFAVASGAACSSANPEPSHVLRAMGVEPDLARGALRVSLGVSNTIEQVDDFLHALRTTVLKLQRLTAVAV
jgi:cysteine desulfurase